MMIPGRSYRISNRIGHLTVEKAAALVLALLILAVVWYRFQPVKFKDGQVAPDCPRQKILDGEPSFEQGGYRITPLASFELEALVLGAKHYSWGRTGRLVPVDLALGWGPMSDGRIVRKIGIHQYNRFYHWWTRTSIIQRRDVEIHSANMHLIPAREEVAREMKKVKRGQVVSLEGYLVNVKGEDGWSWTTSLTREDIGWGACELIWVEDFSVRTP
ncbi:MAG TPA: hypothetical protein PLT76_00370 [Candidatus Omnitrophota bacterium]|nr:hypothetical protein [Candidatus Omnitrophota bacterium]HPB68545.1 hypothetical protein [Candidatus Omnitrophota bacterium]HQO57164.1 hypothetical protein [Candidatus Omnitrophota bacterium]HQP11590.1 hypothetical protein [Candidatus Omnitrophota bacterium]